MQRAFYTASKFFKISRLVLGALLLLPFLSFAESGESVAIVYNSLSPASKEIAEHYAKLRFVPENQILGLELPMKEVISRSEFRTDLQKPLSKWLEKQKLFTVRLGSIPTGTNGQSTPMFWRVVDAKVRYVVLSYDVPLRISEDSTLNEKAAEKMPQLLRKNTAAVDSELALLPMLDAKVMAVGLVPNPFYNITNASVLHPTNGLLMVARLDGPTPAIAKGLVDKAIEAEQTGLWGRAYIDLRGITNAEYKLGDDWMRKVSEICQMKGIETVVDEKSETFHGTFPMSHIGLYFGWYDGGVSGPFTRPHVEFMPGAVAYHLHSYSAATVRSATQNWVGPLLAKGATATMGCVDEPYLQFTPDLAAFVSRFTFGGFSFGEAAYASQNCLSWQTTVIGDPLYRPFNRPPPELHANLVARNSKLIEWSHLGVVNLNLAQKYPTNEVIQYLQENGTNSAVLMEKLGDLQWEQGKNWVAINAYALALNLKPSPQQELRLLLSLGEKLESVKKEDEALSMFKLLVKKVPDYPGIVSIYKRMMALANRLNKADEVTAYKKEIDRLTGGGK